MCKQRWDRVALRYKQTAVGQGGFRVYANSGGARWLQNIRKQRCGKVALGLMKTAVGQCGFRVYANSGVTRWL